MEICLSLQFLLASLLLRALFVLERTGSVRHKRCRSTWLLLLFAEREKGKAS